MTLKETLNDNKTIQQINELLKPNEYTRIDKLIELIFVTSKDLQLEEPGEQEVEIVGTTDRKVKGQEPKFTPVNFHDDCLVRIKKKLKINFIKQTRIAYTNKEKTIGLVCAISKAHKQGKNEKYWFAFHPHQREFLSEFEKSYVAYGCGSADNTFLIPFSDFLPLVQKMWATENEDRIYWHVVIHQRDKQFLLQQPKSEVDDLLDIIRYKV